MTLPSTVSTAALWSDWTFARQGPFSNGTDRYVMGVDKTANKLRCFKSADGGHTWAEQDSADAPATSTTAARKYADACSIGSVIYCALWISASSVPIARFDMSTDQWQANIASPTITAPNSPTPARVGLVACTVSGVNYLILVYRGADDTVMSTTYLRYKLHQYNLNTSTWTGPYDIVGSANTPAANTAPGTQVDYFYGGCASSGTRAHLLFRTLSDPTTVNGYLRQRVWLPGNPGTFAAANVVISGTDSSPSQSLGGTGIPAAYTRNGTTGLLVPYSKNVAGVSGGLSVARCADATTAHIVTNWTQEVVTAMPVETAVPSATGGGIPGAVCADGEKCWCWIVDDSQQTWYADDGGGTTWSEAIPWKKSDETYCGGIGALKTGDEIGVVYYDGLGQPLQVQDQSDSRVMVPASTSVYRYAQRIRFANAETLTAVRVLAERLTTNPEDLAIHIYADDGSGTKPGGTAPITNGLAAVSWLTTPVGREQWYTARFTATGPALSAATYYWLVVGPATGVESVANDMWALAQADSRVYADGARATADNGGVARVWTVDGASGDIAFHVYTADDSLPRLRYDRLIVFRAKASLAVGSTSTTYDLGEPLNTLDLSVDFGSGSDPAGAIDVLIEHSHDAGAWIEYAHAGSDAAAGGEVIRLTDVGRYVRVTSTVTGSASVVGVAGV